MDDRHGFSSTVLASQLPIDNGLFFLFLAL